jgi:hypothetical protein
VSNPRNALVQHALIAIAVPFTTVAAMATHLYPALLDRFFAPPPDLYLLVLLMVAIGQAVSANALMKERIVGFAPRIRELVLFLIGSYAVLVLLDGAVFRGELQPLSAVYIYPLVLASVLWLLCYVLHRALKRRELYLSLVESKEGAELVNAVREMSEESGETDSAIRLMRRLTLVLLVFHLVMLTGMLISVPEPPALSAGLAVAQVATAFLTLVTANRYTEMHYLLGSGVVPDRRYRRRRNAGVLLVAMIALGVAIPVSRDKPAFSPDRIGDMLVQLNEMMNRRTLDREAPQAVVFDSESNDGFGPSYRPETESEQVERSDFVARIARVVAIAVAVTLAGWFLYFLVRPLVTTRRRRAGAGASTYLARVVALGRRFLEGIRALLAWFREQPQAVARTTRTVTEKVQRAIAERQERRSEQQRRRRREKQIAADPYVRAVVRVARWAASRGIRYERGQGVRTFLNRVTERFPDLSEYLETVSRVVERAVYSSHEIAEAERELFTSSVKTLLRTKRSS